MKDAPYRTVSGQTGIDAYLYEAAQLANRARELREDTARLIHHMVDELPDDAFVNADLSSPRFPDATHRIEGEGLKHALRMQAHDPDELLDWVRGLWRKDHIVMKRHCRHGETA